jgi:hypothetical protein
MNPTTPSIQSRMLFGAAAAMVSTLVLSSVLWLFSATAPSSASAPSAHIVITQNDHAGAERVRVR